MSTVEQLDAPGASAPDRGHLLEVKDLRDLGTAVERCRRLLDADADPVAVDAGCARRAHAAQDGHAVAAGQHAVEDHGVELLAYGKVHGVQTVGNAQHDVAEFDEPPFDEPGRLIVIFGKQDCFRMVLN